MTHNKLDSTLFILSPSVVAAAALYRGRGITQDGYLYNGSTHVKYLGIAREDAAIGVMPEATVQGVAVCETGANVTQGDILGFDTVGRVVPYASAVDNTKIGRALETISTGAGYEVRVLLDAMQLPFSAAVDGLGTKYVARATFDATSGVTTGAAYSLGVTVPDNAILQRSYYDVTTTFTSATDAATIAIHAEGANDIVTATAISAGGNIWDAGMHEGIQDGTIALAVKTTAARALTVTLAGGEDLTNGYFVLFVEYVVSA